MMRIRAIIKKTVLSVESSPQAAPDAVCVSYTHDRDYGHFKDEVACASLAIENE